MTPLQYVQITVTCSQGHLIGTWQDSIREKYPFYCEDCGEYARDGSYPWSLTTQIVPSPQGAGTDTSTSSREASA